MSAQDLIFVRTSDGSTIYDPETIGGTVTQITVTNMGDTNLSSLGLYIVPATSVGDVDNPADFPPQTDYQDLLTWGQKTELGLVGTGGLVLTVPQNDSLTFSDHVTRNRGASYTTRIPFIDLAAGDSATFSVQFQTPAGEPSRRFFIDLKLE
jgi:hypothetical protein